MWTTEETTFGRGTKARDGGGVLLTQGIHTLDLLISLAGTPGEVFSYAVTSPLHRMETEDVAAGAARWESGAIGTILATLPTLLVFFAMQRQFVQGMLGSVK